MTPGTIRGLLGSAVLALACACVFTALSLYGVISVEGARILLFAAWVICVIGSLISESVWGTIWPRGIFVVLGVALVLGLCFWRLDGWAVHKRTLSQENPPQSPPVSGPSTENAIPKKELPQPPTRKRKTPPTQVINSADPYIGTSNAIVATWALQEADKVEA